MEDIEEAACGAGRGVNFVAVVHFSDFDIEAVLLEDAGGEAGEVEECVYADGEVWGMDDGKFGGGVLDCVEL